MKETETCYYMFTFQDHEDGEKITRGMSVVQASTQGKRNACYYCSKLVTKMSQHVVQRHSNEVDVAKMMAKPIHTKERKQMLQLIMYKGNYYHNKMVIAARDGEIIPVRKPCNPRIKADEYGPCPMCLGYFLKTDLWKHNAYHCIGLESTGKCRQGKSEILMQSELLQEVYPKFKSVLEVVKKMRADNITMIVKKTISFYN